MARQETFDTLRALAALDAWPLDRQSASGIRDWMRKLASLFSIGHGQRRLGVDEPLVVRLALALRGMGADRWPDTVYALDDLTDLAAAAEGVSVFTPSNDSNARIPRVLSTKE